MNLHKLLSFEQGRIVFFETLTKHPENWQQNATPFSIVRKMLDKTSLDDKKILILFNIEFLQVLVEERKINPENIYYIADNELEYLSGIKIFKVKSYKISKFDVPSLKELIRGINVKFDLVFSNPPYNRGLDIKILNEIIDVAGEFVIVHPSTWLFDLKGKTKLYSTFKHKISNRVKSIETFNGSSVFNIVLNSPVSITHIDNEYSGKIKITHFTECYCASNIFEVSKYGESWNKFIKQHFESMQRYCSKEGNIWQHNIITIDENKFHCQLASIIGNINKNLSKNELYKDDFYTLIVKDEKINKGIRISDLQKPGNPIPTFEFDDENQRDNFIKYLKTDFVRFNLSMMKNNPAVSLGEMELIPWLDFTEEWDDEKLFKKFDVSQELQDYIRDFLPDYYGIRK